MNTFAALIRRHERNAGALYVPPRSDRESSPGRYDKTASQKAPSLDRREIRESARGLGRDMGIPESDLMDIDDFEDLNGLLLDIQDPSLPDIPETTSPLPDFTMPEFPDATFDPPSAPGPQIIHVAVLFSDSVSISKDAGATWLDPILLPTPGAIGLGARDGGMPIVATQSELSRLTDLSGSWSSISIPAPDPDEVFIRNGDFEDYTAGWTYVSGDTPRTRQTIDPPQLEGSTAYLTRDWVAVGNGEFEIEQAVSVEASTATPGDQLTLSADVLWQAGSVVEIGLRLAESNGFFVENGGVLPLSSDNANKRSSPLSELRFSGDPADLSDISSIDELYVDMTFNANNTSNHEEVLRFSFSGWSGQVSGSTPSPYPSSPSDAFEFVDYQARAKNEFKITLTKSGRGDIELTVPAGWQFPYGRRSRFTAFGNNSLFIGTTSGSPNQSYPISIANPEPDDTLIRATNDPSIFSDGWEVVSGSAEWNGETGLKVYIKTDTQISAAVEAYIDNIRLQVSGSSGALDIVDISGGSLGVSVVDRKRGIDISGDQVSQRALSVDPFQVARTSSGASFYADELGIYTPGGRIIATNSDPITHLVGGTDRLLAVRDSGSFVEFQDTDDRTTIRLSTLLYGAHVAWSQNLDAFLAVEPDGAVKSSENGETWSDLPHLPDFEAGVISMPDMRIGSTKSGWLYVWSPGWKHMLWMRVGGSEWSHGGELPHEIVDVAVF